MRMSLRCTAPMRSRQSRRRGDGIAAGHREVATVEQQRHVGVLQEALDLRHALHVGGRVVVEDGIVAALARDVRRARDAVDERAQRRSSRRSSASSPPRPGFAMRSGPPASHRTGGRRGSAPRPNRSSVWRSPARSSSQCSGSQKRIGTKPPTSPSARAVQPARAAPRPRRSSRAGRGRCRHSRPRRSRRARASGSGTGKSVPDRHLERAVAQRRVGHARADLRLHRLSSSASLTGHDDVRRCRALTKDSHCRALMSSSA